MGTASLLPMSVFKRSKLRLDLPIAQRLTLGFMVAALIAGVVVGAIGLLHQQALNEESNFYQNLLQEKTDLIDGSSYLQGMDNTMHDIVYLLSNQDTSAISQETLQDDSIALHGLENDYQNVLKNYRQKSLLSRHPDQMALLQEVNASSESDQQVLLLESVNRTWTVCQSAQNVILSEINQVIADIGSNSADASEIAAVATNTANLERLQGEPTNADTQSATRALIQFTTRLSTTVRDAVMVEEQDQLFTTIAGSLFAILTIILVGLFISSALVARVKELRSITRSIEEGDVARRVKVVGKDEIADISSAINGMLEIIMAEQEIVAASELKDQFIASVSHELRNPLAGVFGWLEILAAYQGKLDAETQERFLNKAIHGCQEIMHLIDSILDSTHVGMQIQVPQFEDVSVIDAVCTVVDHLDPREASNYDVQIHVDEYVQVYADQHSLRQILRNLISNALKYSPKQSSICIEAALDEQSSAICISVKDTGPGIPPEEIPRLFQKFVRLPRDKASSIRGTGLGLYICKQLVESMHGHIWVESQGIPGEGSRFCFTLPSTSRKTEIVHRTVESTPPVLV